MRASIFFLLLSVMLAECHNARRDQPTKQGSYAHAVIRKQMAYEEAMPLTLPRMTRP